MASNPTVLWYVTRAAGLVSLLLLTAVVVLGILISTRWTSPTWPRFASQILHRSLSLTAVTFLTLHIVTAVLDPFAQLGITAALIPFTSPYRTLWLGLGVVAAELIAALVITSLLRARLGFRTWRAIHWLAYASWPIALLHGLGTGTDARVGWALLLDAGCVGAVLVALAMRLSVGSPRWIAFRATAGLLTAAGALALAIWTVTGPLQAGWAKAAGTPSGLLASAGGAASGSSAPSAASPAPAPTPASGAALQAGLNVRIRGTVAQNSDGSDTLTLTDARLNLQIVIGVPANGSNLLQVSVSRAGAALCSVTGNFDGRVVTAACGSTQMTLALSSSDDGGIRGTLTTVAGTP